MSICLLGTTKTDSRSLINQCEVTFLCSQHQRSRISRIDILGQVGHLYHIHLILLKYSLLIQLGYSETTNHYSTSVIMG